MGEKQRFDWVDAAKGLSMTLVVMMYAAYNVGKHTGETGVLHYIIGFATPFRMPEFFLISGLFLSQVIARDWRRYGDRRVVHYFYFYVLWVGIDFVLKAGVVNRDLPGMLRGMGFALVQPYGVFWFIYMLAVFSIATKLAWQFKLPHWLVLAIAAMLQMAQINSPSYLLTQFAAYFVFFYAGYVGAPLVFRIVELTGKHPVRAIAVLIAWAIVEAYLVFWPNGTPRPMEMHMGYAAFSPLHLILAIAGSVALCMLGCLLMKLSFMGWLRWIGEHSLVIYVAFTFPMSAIRIVAMESGIITNTSALGILVLFGSLAAPSLLYLATKRFSVGQFLFERPVWAHIPGTAGSRLTQPAVEPAE